MNQEPTLEETNWLQAFRHKIINLLLGSVLGLGSLGLLLGFYQEWQSGAGPFSFIVTYYLIAYILIVILFFVRRISDHWRATGFLTLLYVFSLFAFYSGWLAGSGRTFLLPLIVLAAILIGPWAGVVAAITSLVTYIFFGIAFSQGWMIYGFAPILADPLIILIEGIGFAMTVGMTSIGLWFFRQGLNTATNAMKENQKTQLMLTERAHELDASNQLLAERSQTLERVNEELERQNWHNVGESLINEALRGEQEISSLANKILAKICTYLNFRVGALFMLENDILKRVGTYAYPNNTSLKDQFNIGEGLIGQTAIEKHTFLIKELPPESISISSGLGFSPPAGLLIFPILYNDQVSGVLEFGLLESDTEEEIIKKIAFLELVSENISVALNTAQDRAQIDQLLAETQRQAEELKTQETELRAANEELHAQANNLKQGEIS